MAKTQQYYSLTEYSIIDYEVIPLPEAALLWCSGWLRAVREHREDREIVIDHLGNVKKNTNGSPIHRSRCLRSSATPTFPSRLTDYLPKTPSKNKFFILDENSPHHPLF